MSKQRLPENMKVLSGYILCNEYVVQHPIHEDIEGALIHNPKTGQFYIYLDRRAVACPTEFGVANTTIDLAPGIDR